MFEMPDQRLDLVKPFFINNNFTLIEEKDSLPYFVNDLCKVEVDLENENYNIYWRDKTWSKCMTVSNDLNIYFVIGFLTYNDLIDRNFKPF